MRNGPSFRGQHFSVKPRFLRCIRLTAENPMRTVAAVAVAVAVAAVAVAAVAVILIVYNCSCRRQSSGVVDAIDDIIIYSRSIGIQYLQTCLRQKHTAIAVLALIRDRLIEIDPGTAKLRHTTLDRNKNRLEANHTCSRR